MHFIGIEIGGSKLQIFLGDDNAQVQKRFTFAVNANENADGIRKNILEALNQVEQEYHAIGIGFGGPVNRTSGKVWRSYHITGWADFNLIQWLSAETKKPVFVDNDANVAALGEALHGAGKNFNTVLFITLGSGVGGGLVVNKKLYHGALPGEVEIGHIRLDKTGKTLQSASSGWAVDEKIRNAAKNSPTGKLAQLTKELSKAEATILRQAIKEGDSDALHIFNECVDDLAFGLSHAVQLFHPEAIILGGGLSLIGESLGNLLEQRLPLYLMDAFQPGPFIRLSALREYAVPIGALTLAAQQYGETANSKKSV